MHQISCILHIWQLNQIFDSAKYLTIWHLNIKIFNSQQLATVYEQRKLRSISSDTTYTSLFRLIHRLRQKHSRSTGGETVIYHFIKGPDSN